MHSWWSLGRIFCWALEGEKRVKVCVTGMKGEMERGEGSGGNMPPWHGWTDCSLRAEWEERRENGAILGGDFSSGEGSDASGQHLKMHLHLGLIQSHSDSRKVLEIQVPEGIWGPEFKKRQNMRLFYREGLISWVRGSSHRFRPFLDLLLWICS